MVRASHTGSKPASDVSSSSRGQNSSSLTPDAVTPNIGRPSVEKRVEPDLNVFGLLAVVATPERCLYCQCVARAHPRAHIQRRIVVHEETMKAGRRE
jgi:hypothetical protein